MPKLTKTKAKQVEESGGTFEPLPPGVYHVRLVDVDASREGPSGPYWSWEYDVVEDGHVGRKLWNNTSLSDAALWKLDETFSAFGMGADTDTDELLGKVVKAVVSIRTIQEGARKGEPANQIDRLTPADSGFEAPTPAAGQPDPEDVFS